MKTVVIPKEGDHTVLEIRESPDPIPAEGQIVISVKASGLNFADVLSRQGLYPDRPPLPVVMGYEVSGVISAVHESLPLSLVGKSVVALVKFGGHASKVIAYSGFWWDKPKELTYAEAASLPVVYITAAILLLMGGELNHGDTLLVHNAGGGVGLALIDFAKRTGATIIGTASASKHDRLKSRGLHHVIDYHTEDVDARVLSITNGRGVDLILDPLGGEYWSRNYNLLSPTGRLGMYGASSIASTHNQSLFSKLYSVAVLFWKMPTWKPLGLMDVNKGVYGVNMGHMWKEKEKLNKLMNKVLAGVQEGWIRPVVDSIYTLEEAGQSHLRLEKRANFGKVLLAPEGKDVANSK